MKAERHGGLGTVTLEPDECRVVEDPVRMKPGHTAVTPMPSAWPSARSERDKPTTPCLLAL
jgi:hypothetical protein